jgi:hypothetical protein
MNETPVRIHGGVWDRRDLVRRLCHALDIASQAVALLAVSEYAIPGEMREHLRPEKVISETAFLLLAASTASHYPEVKERIDHVAQLLIPSARSDRIRLGMCLNPALALDYAHAHICLSRLGYTDTHFDASLAEARRSQSCLGHERVPHRILEQEWNERSWPAAKILSRRRSSQAGLLSVLNCPMDLLHGTSEDVYAFTHALMYLRDFNILPLPLPRNRGEILREAEGALARCLDEQDYDLGGEVLMAWPLTGRSWGPAAFFGFRVLAGVEDQAGFLPTASTRLEPLRSLVGVEREKYLLATAYHTIYVMGLLCAVSLQDGRVPRSYVSVEGQSGEAAREILAYLDSDGKKTHWRNEVDRMERSALAGIAPLLFHVALRRRAVENDFASLVALLEIGTKYELARTPMASQAAEMVMRVSSAFGSRAAELAKPAVA